MKFHKGDIVLVEARVEEDVSDNFLLCSLNTSTRTFHQEGFNAEIEHVRPFEAKKYDDPVNYTKGANDAWELARKVTLPESDGGYSSREAREIFGSDGDSLLMLKSFVEVKRLVEKWEKTLHTGDLVYRDSFEKGVITREDDETSYVLWSNGICERVNNSDLTKFGKLDATQEFLDRIDEER